MRDLPHYTDDPDLPVYFYGGWLSSFAPFWFTAGAMRPLSAIIARA